MFGPATVSLLVVVLLLSLLTRQAPLLLLALALLLAAGLSKLWERYCLVGLEYRRRFSQRRVNFGEPVELEIEVVNRKILPLAWLEIEDEVPKALPIPRGHLLTSHKVGRAILANLIALRPYERVRRRYVLPCQTRGEHVFGPVRLKTGDLFGLVTRELDLDARESLIVYPRVVPLARLGLPARQPLGDLRTQSWLFEDPSRFVGAREHRPGDSLRRIHWGASARSGRLQVKVFEATTSHQLALFLDLNTTGPWWNLTYDADVLELGITTAASLARWAIEQGYPVGLATNGMHRGQLGRVAVDSGAGPNQLQQLLEALARLEPFATRPFARVVAEGARRLPFGATVVVVAAGLDAAVVAELLALRRRGHPVVTVLTMDRPIVGSLDGIVVRRVGPPESWRELPTLEVAR